MKQPVQIKIMPKNGGHCKFLYFLPVFDAVDLDAVAEDRVNNLVQLVGIRDLSVQGQLLTLRALSLQSVNQSIN